MGSTNRTTARLLMVVTMAISLSGCVPALKLREARKDAPATYGASTDTTDAATVPWRDMYTDPDLRALIDTALVKVEEGGRPRMIPARPGRKGAQAAA